MGLEDHNAAQKPSRIVVADDHPLFRSAIRCILDSYPDLEVVAEAADGREALELCRHQRPDLVLMDLGMPVMDGVAATRAIKRELPETFVLVLTALDESERLSDALQAGATGYILKDAPAERIIDAMRRSLAGGSPLDEGTAMRLLRSLMDGKPKEKERGQNAESAISFASQRPAGERAGSRPDASLTPREAEVMRLVAQGQTNQQIARNLLISVSTVKRHIRHATGRLGACDRVQAAVRASELRLLDERNGA